jgi:hypothetical protein
MFFDREKERRGIADERVEEWHEGIEGRYVIGYKYTRILWRHTYWREEAKWRSEGPRERLMEREEYKVNTIYEPHMSALEGIPISLYGGFHPESVSLLEAWNTRLSGLFFAQ